MQNAFFRKGETLKIANSPHVVSGCGYSWSCVAARCSAPGDELSQETTSPDGGWNEGGDLMAVCLVEITALPFGSSDELGQRAVDTATRIHSANGPVRLRITRMCAPHLFNIDRWRDQHAFHVWPSGMRQFFAITDSLDCSVKYGIIFRSFFFYLKLFSNLPRDCIIGCVTGGLINAKFLLLGHGRKVAGVTIKGCSF